MPDWNDVLKEIHTTIALHNNQAQLQNQAAQGAVDVIRRKYLQALRDKTGRNVIAYYSGFLSKPDAPMLGITDEDKNGLMMAVHSIGGQERRRGLDLILHTPGGSIAATESLVDYLHKMFGNDIRAIVPQIAMSAGAMIACSCKEILMTRHANLGPIDPQLGSLPAYGVKEEFERACKEVKEDSSKIPIWQAIIGRYGPTFLSQCENAIDWSKKFVEKQLEQVMFHADPKAKEKAKKIVRQLTDYRGNKTHARHIHFEELQTMGLKVSLIEDDQDFQDVVLTVHHCFMHSLMNTPAFKMIENHKGSAFVKQQLIQQMMVQAVPKN
jgi:ATP-dependent protease ClpP protease subunit